jgi:nephrocystin-4
MYHQRRKFVLGCSNPRLIKFSHAELDIPAQGQRNIGIQVCSQYEAPGIKDVLIFINDEDNRNEECYKVRVHVYQPDG